MALLVQKFGGTSVGSVERLQAVARRIADCKEEGNDLVIVVSAMGHTTDELTAKAKAISAAPPQREMDMLLSTGEQVSIALLSMALHELGVPAVSMTGAQVGIVTESAHGRARILDVRTDRLRARLAEGQVVVVAGFQGTSLSRGGSSSEPLRFVFFFECFGDDDAILSLFCFFFYCMSEASSNSQWNFQFSHFHTFDFEGLFTLS